MMSLKIVSIAAGAVLAAGMATAQPYSSQGTVSGWTVFANGATGTCFAEKVMSDGKVMQISMPGATTLGYIAVFQHGMEPVSIESVSARVGNYIYGGKIVSAMSGAYEGSLIPWNNPDLPNDLAGDPVIHVMPAGAAPYDLNAAGAASAMQAAMACQGGMAS